MLNSFLYNQKHQIVWNEYGAPDGKPVFYFNAVLGSRLEAQPSDKIARDLGIRLIATDRPGYGDSDPQNGFRLLDWPDVISQLADKLNLAHFSILGFSIGSAYALACAHAMPKRIRHITLIGSTAPYTSKAMQNHICADFKPLYDLSVADEQAALQQVAQLASSPEALMDIVKAPLHLCDTTLFKQENIKQPYLDNMALAISHGVNGIVNDLRNVALPWQFEPGDIQLPVNLWHGRNDNAVDH
ncbi:MAG: alpha/beta hydrolase, partial [Gammaproteobacteria bacterium]|nr:alpha/beta hydrolase [Gammaproteobacteria bacterium]